MGSDQHFSDNDAGMNRRRALIALACATALPALVAQAQTRIWRIGVLSLRKVFPNEPDVSALPRQLRQLGYVEGRNLKLDWHSANGRYERLPGLAREVAAGNPDVIVAAGTPSVAAAQKATATIPIVMTVVSDPIGSGFVKSLAHPGGNITGITNLTGDLGAKQLELLRRIAPHISRVGVLVNPTNPGNGLVLRNVESVASKGGPKLLVVEASRPDEIQVAFPQFSKEHVGAVMVLPDGFMIGQRREIAQLAVEHHLPTIFATRDHVDAGGLMSYGPNFAELYGRAALYVDKILKGAKPAELPVEQPANLELVINMKTAKALSITVPQDLLLRASELVGG
jgi:putative tryptophan/tyrosine transport system substrate-binding protein